jgi:uncharacterized membrane protein YbaN (DUF454 family)
MSGMTRRTLSKAAYAAAGTAFLLLGIVGAFLPLLPTTPFVLLAAACYVRGSPRAYAWLMGHRVFGATLRAYREGRGIPGRAKASAVVALWGSMGITMYALANPVVLAFLALIGAGVTLYLLNLPTARG